MPKRHPSKKPSSTTNTAATDHADSATRLITKLSPRDWVPILLAITIPTLIAITRLPPGVCFGDGGDLQLSSVTLGIGHPPGYPVLSTIGYILTRTPFIDHAYMITLACALSGAIAAYLCGLIQLRLGVNRFIAAATATLFLAHPWTWFNVVGPEVYMPSVAMLAGCVYCFTRFTEDGSQRHFFASTLLFGFALFTRPPTLFSLPFFLVATIVIDRQRKISGTESTKRILFGALLIAAPGVYSFGYILVRDQTNVAYNYIDLHNAESQALPDSTSGISARFERALWTMTGQQFKEKMGANWSDIRAKITWIHRSAFPVERSVLVLILAIAIAGMMALWIRRRSIAVVLIGFVAQNVVFVCAYQVHGQEANLLPLLLTTTIFCGVAVSGAIARLAIRQQALVATGIAILGVGTASTYVMLRSDYRALFDATGKIERADLAMMPEDSVIISEWGVTTPLRYAHHFANRPDIHIETVSIARWGEFARKFDRRPVFVPRINEQLASKFRATEFRNFFLLEPLPSGKTD